MRRLWMPVCIAITILSCQEEVDGGGNYDYIPMTPGSNWRYTSSRYNKYDLEVTSRDTFFHGHSYRIFNRLNYSGTGGTVKNYYSKEGKTYWTYGTPAITILPGDIILLKDTLIHTNWTSTVPGVWPDNHKFTITARDTQRIVNNMHFDHVIALDYEWSETNPNVGGIVVLGNGKFYYARGVGLIESYCEGAWGFGTVSDTVQLYYYEIKR